MSPASGLRAGRLVLSSSSEPCSLLSLQRVLRTACSRGTMGMASFPASGEPGHGCDLVWGQLLEGNLVHDWAPESRVQHLPCWHLTLRVGGAFRAGHLPVKSSGGKALASSLPGLGVLVSVLPSSW